LSFLDPLLDKIFLLLSGDRTLVVKRGVTIDMHGNRLTGIPAPVGGNDPVRLVDLEKATGDQDSIKALISKMRGDPGRDGVPGNDGNAGRDGRDGNDGSPGAKGDQGDRGLIGERGTPGKDGLDGRAGKDGRDGAPGLPGRDGLDGKDGKPGEKGKDGKDSSSGASWVPPGSERGQEGYVLGIVEDAGMVDHKLGWVEQTGTGGSGTPGGDDTEIQFNDSGSFGGSPRLVWNGEQWIFTRDTDSAMFEGDTATGTVVMSDGDTASVAIDGPTGSIQILTSGETINLNNDGSMGLQSSTIALSLDADLFINGNAGTAGKALVSQGAGSPPVWDDPAAISSTSDLVAAAADDTGLYLTFGNTSDLPLFLDNDAGTATQVLTSNGPAAAPTWEDAATSLATPGGSDTQLQFNDAGVLGGTANLTWDNVNNTLHFNGTNVDLLANDTTGKVQLLGGTTAQSGLTVDSDYVTLGSLVDIAGYANDGLGGQAFFDLDGVAYTARLGASDGGPNSSTFIAQSDGILQLQSTSELQINTDPGTATQVLTSNGAGFAPTWEDAASSSTPPGGADTQLQYNNAGSFGGLANATWDGAILNLGAAANDAVVVNSTTHNVSAKVNGGKASWDIDDSGLAHFLGGISNNSGLSIHNASGNVEVISGSGYGLYVSEVSGLSYIFANAASLVAVTDSGFNELRSKDNLFVYTGPFGSEQTLQLKKEGDLLINGDAGTAGQVLTSVGAGAPFVWDDPAASYTDEQAQDAVGAMVDASLTYIDATPLLQRAALTGHITASAGSNATMLGSFTKAQLDTAVSDGNVLYVGDITQYTDELAQEAVLGIVVALGLNTALT